MESVTREKNLQKRKAGLAGAAAKWRKLKKAERSAIMRELGRRPHWRPGRPKNPDRCPCEAMTRARAQKRNHKCLTALASG